MIRFLTFTLLIVAAISVPYVLLSEKEAVDTDLPTHRIDRRDIVISVTEQGTLESANNTEIKCRVRGDNTITFVIESGSLVSKGDILVQLDTLAIEEEISERTKFFHQAEATVARSRARLENARITIEEYIEGSFPAQKASLQQGLAAAEAELLSSQNQLKHARMMAQGNYQSELTVEQREFDEIERSNRVALLQTQIEVLEKYTKQEQLAKLNGELEAAKATLEADLERSLADKKRMDRALEELQLCTIRAERSGLVIYPNGEQWEDVPEIEQGATVKKDQTLLLMPDLRQMQVKVGIHESVMDRMTKGSPAEVTLNKTTYDGEVSYVASVAQPAGWWTGNVVKYDSIVQLPELEGLRPGMSAEVEIIFAKYFEELVIPFNACVQFEDSFACWVKQGEQITRRAIELGDGDEMFNIVVNGLQPGDEVILEPLSYVAEAQAEVAKINANSDTSKFGYEDL